MNSYMFHLVFITKRFLGAPYNKNQCGRGGGGGRRRPGREHSNEVRSETRSAEQQQACLDYYLIGGHAKEQAHGEEVEVSLEIEIEIEGSKDEGQREAGQQVSTHKGEGRGTRRPLCRPLFAFSFLVNPCHIVLDLGCPF